MNHIWRLLLLCAIFGLALFPLPAAASPGACASGVVTLRADFHEAALEPCLSWLEEPLGKPWGIGEALRASPDDWTSNGEKVFNYGSTRSGVWFRLFLRQEDGPRELLLEVGTSLIDRVELWVLSSAGEIHEHGLSGDTVNASGMFRSGTRRPIYRLHTERNSFQEIWVRVSSTSALTVPFRLMTDEELVRRESRELSAIGIYLGVALAMIVFNGFSMVYTRRSEFFHYVLYSFFLASYVLAVEGFGKQFIWDELSWFQQHTAAFSLHMVACNMLLFTWKYLQGGHFATPLKWVFFVGIVFSMVGGLQSLFVEDLEKWGTFFSRTVPALVFLGMGGAVLFRIREWRKDVRLFVWGWMLFLMGGALEVLRIQGIVPQSFLTVWVWKIGNSLESVFLSLGLVEKMKKIQQENEELKYEMEREMLQKSYELRMGKLEELGRIAIVLGDSINSPLNSILLGVEECRDETAEENRSALYNTIERSALRIRNEMQSLNRFKEYAPENALEKSWGLSEVGSMKSEPLGEFSEAG